MTVDIAGLCGILVFYVLILVVGIVAARVKRGSQAETVSETENVITAGRDIGYFVGIFTMTATYVGGGYINGVTENVFTEGLGIIWTTVPVALSLSMVTNGLFFTKIMREQNYVTMLDPFQEHYGSVVGGLMIVPAFCGEMFWSAAILAALGSTMSIILGLRFSISVIISAAVAGGYTLFGGMFSVAFTDVAQLICIVFGLVLSIPFAWFNEHVDMSMTSANHTLWTLDWKGSLELDSVGRYIDIYLVVIFGGIPWQSAFQRVLSAKSAKVAQVTTFVAAVLLFIFAIPPVIIGIIAKHTDWNATGLGYEAILKNPALAMPAVIAYLTPKAVSFFGLGAIAAAVMSSADSSILGCSSMFSHNIYRNIFRKQARDIELIWVLRVAIVGCAAISCIIAIEVETIYGLFILAGDVMYVILFPVFFLVLYGKPVTNSYGVIMGCVVGLVLRLLAGEPLFNLTSTLIFPLYNYSKHDQEFPHRTLAMLCNAFTNVFFSILAYAIFVKYQMIPLKFDFCRCFVRKDAAEIDKLTEESRKRRMAHLGTKSDRKMIDEHESMIQTGL